MQGRAGQAAWAGADPALDHERCHWVQFNGTSFGAAYTALLCSEDSNLKEMYRVYSEDVEFRAYVRSRVGLGHPIVPLDQLAANPSLAARFPEGVVRYAKRLLVAKLMRRLLLDPTPHWPLFAKVNTDAIIDGGIESISRAYDKLTVNWRERTDPDVPASGIPRPHAALYAGQEVTTSNLLETGAMVCELSHAWQWAWTQSNMKVPSSWSFVIEDALRNASGKYTLCIHIARRMWKSLLVANSGRIADEFARMAPTLACCIDLALNPCIPPASPWFPQSWEDIYPPSRLMRLLRGVQEIGLLDDWDAIWLKLERNYRQYREQLLEASGLRCPAYNGDSGSRLHLSGDSLTEEGMLTNDQAMQLTQFDYAIWSVERLRQLRERHPMAVAFPPKMFRDFGFYAGLLSSSDDVAVSAPLYNADAPWSFNGRLTTAVASKIFAEVATSWLLQRISLSSGPVALRDAIGYNFRELDVNARFLMDHYTLTPELSQYVMPSEVSDPDVVDQFPTPPPSTLRYKLERRRIFSIEREDIARADFRNIEVFFESLRLVPADKMGTIDLAVSHYHYEERDLWEIPEVMAFLRMFQSRNPWCYWYLYLHQDPNHCMGFSLLFRSCLASPYEVTSDELNSFLMTVEHGLQLEGNNANSDEATIVDRMADFTTVLANLFRSDV
jgi:hypothetical protein